MEKKIKVNVEPIGKRIFLEKPQNSLKAIIDAGIGIKSICGGNGTCGKCRIIFNGAGKPDPNLKEKETLTEDEIIRGIRLACQHDFKSNTNIYIPASSLSEEQKLQITGEEKEINIDPVCKKYFLKLNKATLNDLKSDLDRIHQKLMKDYGVKFDEVDYEVMKNISDILRESSWEVTVTLRKNEIININRGNSSGDNFGIAVDLGTTKIAVLLINLNDGRTIDSKGIMNPQISYGEDVMSRLNYAIQSENNLKEIQSSVISKINQTIEEICLKNNITCSDVSEICVVGNTAMHHLFLGLSVKQLSLSPFVPLTDKKHEIKAREVGIKISSGGYLYMLPPIAGFVGSDHLAMILASGIYKNKGNYLGIDIGTNTEIVLKSPEVLTSVSTASGPAFEGAHIKYGMRAAPGAIERVVIDQGTGFPLIQTIGEKNPSGICGSGILDAVAELLKAGIIGQNGKFNKDSKNVCVDEKGQLQYVLYNKNNDSLKQEKLVEKSDAFLNLPCNDENISITQKDIVEIQLAKSAIRTGIEVLLENAGISFKDIDRIIIAGAFGSYIDPRNVVNIGMFPNISLEKIIQIGNAAAIGAKMALLSGKARKLAEKIAEEVNYLELTVFPSFNKHFISSIMFPESDKIV